MDDALKKLYKIKHRIYKLSSSLNAEFKFFAKKCEFRKQVVPGEDERAPYNRCTNIEHKHSFTNRVICRAFDCPFLKE